MIKIFENFKEIYHVDPTQEVVIKDEYIGSCDFINKKLFIDEYRDDYLERRKEFTGKVATMEYEKDDFFSIITFKDGKRFKIPSHMLINKEEYDLLNAMKKYNL